MENTNNNANHNESRVNGKLTTICSEAERLEEYLMFKFGSVRLAATAVGWSPSRLRQIFLGYKIPFTRDLISRLSAGWEIDSIQLTLLFTAIKKAAEQKNTTEETGEKSPFLNSQEKEGDATPCKKLKI